MAVVRVSEQDARPVQSISGVILTAAPYTTMVFWLQNLAELKPDMVPDWEVRPSQLPSAVKTTS